MMSAGRWALADELLLKVQKPARYLGNEMNAVHKGAERDFRAKKRGRSSVRFAMCFPDVYEIGMSHLGIQILYELFNRREDTWCERVFSPWTDMERVLRENGIPLFALESQDPVRDFDFLGFTLQFELCYTNVLQVLDLSGIPLDSADRTQDDPIVIGGGPCACNPEPMARFFDLFYIGEGETSYDALLDLYRRMKAAGEAGSSVPHIAGGGARAVFAGEQAAREAVGKTEPRPEDGRVKAVFAGGQAAGEAGSAGWDRKAFLRAAAQIPGIYVPSLYEASYAEDGTIASFAPKKMLVLSRALGKASETDGGGELPCAREQLPARVRRQAAPGLDGRVEETFREEPLAPARVRRQAAPGLDGREEETFREEPLAPARVRRQAAPDLDDPVRAPYPEKPLIPFLTVTQDRVAVELQRGCIRGCRFCQAGMIYRPNRERSLKTVKKYADEMLGNTGQDDILLSSLSSSDYSCIKEIVDHVSSRYEADRVKLQVPSLRIDSFSLDLMAKVQDVRRSSLTFAPEAGSQRLRDVINKGLTEEDILEGAREAFRGGWDKVKLYFMLGLPTETQDDRTAISDLANRICAAYYEEVPKEKRNGRCRITVSTSFFVPKPFTPFQWARMYRPGDYLGFSATVNHAIYEARNHRSIQYSWHEADGSCLEGVLARGDRRVADLILEAYRLGARFDCWIETWDYARWEQAAVNAGVDMDFYTLRERKKDEIFPWDFIDIGVRRSFLWKEWERAQNAVTTPNCRQACSACGAADYGCGICAKPRAADTAGKEAAGQAVTAYSKPVYPAAEKKMTGLKETALPKSARLSSVQEAAGLLGTGHPGTEPEDGVTEAAEALETVPSVCENAVKGEGEMESPGLGNGQEAPLCYKVRLRLAKYGPMKFVGHLELMRFLQKCIRRTDINIRYSDGITPRMIMSTAMPLGLGIESGGEYIDLELGSPVTTEHALSQLRPLMPEGLDILDFYQLGEPVPAGGGGEGKKKPQKAMAAVAAAEYEVRFGKSFLRSGALPANWRQILEAFAGQDEIPWTKETKKGFRTLDMKELIYRFSVDSSGEFSGKVPFAEDEKEVFGEGERAEPVIRMLVCSRVGENLRPEQLIGEAFKRRGLDLPEDALRIRRLDLFAERPGFCTGKDEDRFISLGEIGKSAG